MKNACTHPLTPQEASALPAKGLSVLPLQTLSVCSREFVSSLRTVIVFLQINGGTGCRLVLLTLNPAERRGERTLPRASHIRALCFQTKVIFLHFYFEVITSLLLLRYQRSKELSSFA